MRKISICLVAVSSVGMMMLAACSTSHKSETGRAAVVTKASTDQQNALLGRVKSLAGTWEMTDDKGQKQVGAVFSVSSNGSVVREVMFPGSSHEMTNMYTMDGDALRLTHYCAMGNQPHMVAKTGGADRIAFAFDSVSNLTARDEMYMGQMTLVFVDQNTIRQEWRSFKNGVLTDHNTDIELTRRVTP